MAMKLHNFYQAILRLYCRKTYPETLSLEYLTLRYWVNFSNATFHLHASHCPQKTCSSKLINFFTAHTATDKLVIKIFDCLHTLVVNICTIRSNRFLCELWKKFLCSINGKERYAREMARSSIIRTLLHFSMIGTWEKKRRSKKLEQITRFEARHKVSTKFYSCEMA